MEKFNFGEYDPNVETDVFKADKGYVETDGENTTRKQFSYPLHEVKEFINYLGEKIDEAMELPDEYISEKVDEYIDTHTNVAKKTEVDSLDAKINGVDVRIDGVELKNREQDNAITKEITDRETSVSQEKSERLLEIDVERKRIDNIVHLPSGSTTGDAELQDIRIGADGISYSSAGDSVRGQVRKLSESITGICDSQTIVPNLMLTFGTLTNGVPTGDTDKRKIYSEYIDTSKIDKIIVKGKTQGSLFFVYYTINENGDIVFVRQTTKGGTADIDYTDDAKLYPIIRLYGYYGPAFEDENGFRAWYEISMSTNLNERFKESERNIVSIEKNVETISDTIRYGEKEISFDDWVQGAVTYSNANRISTKNYHKLSEGTMVISENLRYGVHWYAYRLEDDGSYTREKYNDYLNYGGTTVEIDPKLYYKFTLYCATGITPSDVNKAEATFMLKTKTNFALKSDVYALAHEADILPATWEMRIEEIKTEQKRCFTFGVQTDTHFDGESATIQIANPLRRLSAKVNMDYICNLGDIIRGNASDNVDKSRADMTDIVSRYTDGARCPVLFAIGNHDDNNLGASDMSELINGAELHGRLIKASGNTTTIHTNNQSNYYYVDFEQCRVVVLDTRDLKYNAISSSDVNINHHSISQEQVTWFNSVALNTDKPIVVMCHVPLIVSATTDRIIPDRASDIVNALKSHKTSGKQVVGCFYGHAHAQKSVVSDGINHIVFANGGNFAEIVLIDTAEKTIKTKMVGDYGSKADREFTY